MGPIATAVLPQLLPRAMNRCPEYPATNFCGRGKFRFSPYQYSNLRPQQIG